MKKLKFIVAAILLLSFACQKQKKIFEVKSEDYDLKVEVIADSISVPFGMTFLPSGDMLVSDRPTGDLIRIDKETGAKTHIKGVPGVWGKTDGGLLELLPHPDYSSNGWLYYSFAMMKEDSTGTLVVERGKLSGDSLINKERLFTALPYYKEPNHFGTRMVISNGYLFFTMGDRYDLRDSAQSLSNHLGKVLRIHDDGRIPDDNPFVKTKNAKAEIWSYGHRNPQGLTTNPATGELWEHEHGPKGGDEINIISPGFNYGWPVICYGIDYNGNPIGEGITEHDGMEQPLHYYTPSIAPSGMEFYTGDEFTKWKGNLFIGALALRHLNRLVIEKNKVVHEERLFLNEKWRVRSVKQGLDGLIYIGVDNGMILRISKK